jgi:hypothetical protein
MKSITTLVAVGLLTVIQSPVGSHSLRAQTITTHVRFGTTAVKWEPTFSAALGLAGIATEPVTPAFFVTERDLFRFPICGGAVDFADLDSEITHAGGLRFVRDNRVLSVTDFIHCIPRQDRFDRLCPLSALITADHSLIGRTELFTLDFANSETVISFPKPPFVQRIFITNVVARLTQDGAFQFNQIFGTSFGTAAPVAILTIRIIGTDEL